tara:strand:- start:212 stop:550 length:339 start_codon:yes stop_codon:yes gene_type:complete
MSLSLKGTITKILSEKTFSPKFKKQSIHLTIENGNYQSTIEIDFVNDNIKLLSGYMEGETVEVQINIRGNASKTDPNKIFNSINVWKMSRTQELTNAMHNQDRVEAQNGLSF